MNESHLHIYSLVCKKVVIHFYIQIFQTIIIFTLLEQCLSKTRKTSFQKVKDAFLYENI